MQIGSLKTELRRNPPSQMRLSSGSFFASFNACQMGGSSRSSTGSANSATSSFDGTGESARRIPQGHLELFDLQKEMLEKARRKIESAELHNVGFTQGDAVDLDTHILRGKDLQKSEGRQRF